MTPFRFCSSLNLTLLTNRRARDVAELLHHLREVSGAAIYFHTHHFLVQHQHLSPAPPNNFAHWVSDILQEERLGEQLAAIDVIRFRNLGALRQRVVAVIETFLESSASLRAAPPGGEFFFREAATFIIDTGYVARDLDEFADCIEHISPGSLSYHIFDARLRLERGENDFSEWLAAHSEAGLAGAIARLDPYTHTLDGLRREVVRLIRRRQSGGAC